MRDLAEQVWLRQIRPLAVGAMIVSAFYTLYNLRGSLIAGIGKALKNINLAGAGAVERTDVDLNLKKVLVAKRPRRSRVAGTGHLPRD